MKRHELWRAQYRARRYMAHLSETELRQRTKDIIVNMLFLTEENKIGIHSGVPEGTRWLILWTHALEEFHFRYGGYPAGFEDGLMDDVQIPRPDSSLAERAARTVTKIKSLLPRPGSFIVKYGKREHMRRMHDEGLVRVSPASCYNDASLNPAIRDRELEIYIQPPPGEMVIKTKDPKTGVPKQIHPIGNLITVKSRIDYYVYCLSTIVVPRLFVDFCADSCIIIREPQRFLKELFEAMTLSFPELNASAGPVEYVDPIHTKIRDVNIFGQKHFRYSYQKEFRAVWLPRDAEPKLSPVILKLVEIKRYSSLIEIGD